MPNNSKGKIMKAKKRTLVPGQRFYFIAGNTTGENPRPEDKPWDVVTLNGGGYLVIHDAESYLPPFDRSHNFFFTKKEARAAMAKIRKIIQMAR
jgi:hypothetical protein